MTIYPHTGEVLENPMADEQVVKSREQLIADFGKTKHMLEMREARNFSVYAEDWLKLAEEYRSIDAKANEAYCMARYKHYLSQPAEPAQRYEWQEVNDR